jgi:multiple sugar transport system permease protein
MKRAALGSLTRLALALVAVGIYVLPLYWIVSTSIKSPDQIFQKPPLLFPTAPQWEGYRAVLGLPTERLNLYINMAVYFKNSLIIASSTTLLALVLAIPAAYALARFSFRGRTPYMLFLLVAQMLPSVLLVIPLFVIFKSLGLINNYPGVILADTALALPFAIIILRASFLQIPIPLEEAAWIDGGSRLQVLWHVILPLIRPGLVAVAVFSFLTAWGEFVFALSFLQKPELQPVSIGVFQFVGMYTTNWDAMMAFSTLISIPAIVALLLLQRQFIGGLTGGATK